MWSYGTAAAVSEYSLDKKVDAIWDKALQLKDGARELSLFAQRRTTLLKQRFKILERFADHYKHHKGFGTP